MATQESGTSKSCNALKILELLRRKQFNVDTERKLEEHLFILAAENGSLTLAQRQAFACEQFSIQRSDAISFAFLAGHRGFAPKSLTNVVTPDPMYKTEGQQDLFQFLMSGEVYAAPLLLTHAKSLGLNDEASIASHKKLSALAQAYPSYWARLALQNKRGVGAAACAVNFPAWGRMCRRLHAALAKNSKYGYSGPDDKGLSFIEFFATPIENLDEMAAAVMEQEDVSYEELVEPVRLLQEYEVLFWDAVYDVA